jgi:integrase
MPQNLLTDAKVRSAKPQATPYKLADGGGLFLLVRPNGAKLWRWKFRLAGKENLFAVGIFPAVGLADARHARAVARALVDKGINPAHQRHTERQTNIAASEAQHRATEGAFCKVAEAWLEDGRAVWAAGTYRHKQSRVMRFLTPALDTQPITQIGPREIRPILERCKSAGAWVSVNVKSDLSAIFDFAMQRGLIESNPIPGLRGLLRIPRSESKAALTLRQLRDLFARLRGYRGFPESVLCLRLIALTACRPGEACDAEWSEFDLEANLWRRPAEKMKARRDHVSPLSTRAIALLEDLRVITGGGRYLFPHKYKPDAFATTARLCYLMRDLNVAKGASPHCWRTTFSTWANENGHAPDAIERQLAHVESNRVRATYNKAMMVEERRQIMQAWGDYLALAEAENVIALRPDAEHAAG